MPFTSTKWGCIGKTVIEKKEKLDAQVHKRSCYRKVEYPDLPSYKRLHNSGRMRLESFERAMRFYFENSDMKLGYMQKKLLDVLIVAAMRKFFKDDLVSNLQFLSHKYKIDELNDAVAILFPVCTHASLLTYRDDLAKLKVPRGLLLYALYHSQSMNLTPLPLLRSFDELE